MINPLAGLLSPHHVAIFGSDNLDRCNLTGGAPGETCPEYIYIDPSSHTDTAMPSLQSAPWQPDLAIILASPRPALIECSYAGVPAAVVCGGEQESFQAPLAVRVLHVGASHFGLLPHGIALRAGQLCAGKVALLSNTELVADVLYSRLQQQGIGVSFYASVVPSSDVQIDDLLALLASDNQTETVGLYLEEPARPRMLLDVLSRITADKPVIALLPREDHTSQWGGLLRHAGVVTTASFGEFSQVLAAFNAPRHGGSWLQREEELRVGRPHDWRYASALRHLAGIDAVRPVVEFSSNEKQPQNVDQRNVFISHVEQLPGTIRLTNIPAAVHTAWRHAIKPSSSLAELPKELLRQELAALPTKQAVSLPYIRNLLTLGGIAVEDGIWLQDDCPIEPQVRPLGRPIDAWVIKGDAQSELHRRVGVEKLRRLQRIGERLWVQSSPRSGIEVAVHAERHLQYGPIFNCRSAKASGLAESGEYALPLAYDKAAILADQLVPTHLANEEALASTLEAIGHLFASVPEIYQLDVTIGCLPESSCVTEAQLEWMP